MRPRFSFSDGSYMLGLFTASHNFAFYERHGFEVLKDVHAMRKGS